MASRLDPPFLDRVKVEVFKAIAKYVPETKVRMLSATIEPEAMLGLPNDLVVRYEFFPGAVVVSRCTAMDFLERAEAHGWADTADFTAREIFEKLREEADKRGL